MVRNAMVGLLGMGHKIAGILVTLAYLALIVATIGYFGFGLQTRGLLINAAIIGVPGVVVRLSTFWLANRIDEDAGYDFYQS